MHFIEVEHHVRVAVEDLNPKGSKTVLFLHGWPMSGKIFEYQKVLLCDLGYRVLSMDLRGFGLSDTTENSYRYDNMANDLYIVIENLNLRNFVLAGFGMGGAVAIRYMTRFNGFSVSKLALIAAAAPSFVQRTDYPYGSTAEEFTSLIDKAYKNRPGMVVDFHKDFFATQQDESITNWFQNIGNTASGIGTIRAAMSMRDEDLRLDLKNVVVPTGIFHGRQDKICPFDFARVLHDEIICSTLYPFENSGHMVFYEELDKFNEEFVNFMEEF